MNPSRRTYRICIIGPGKVGSTLAVLLRRAGHTIVAVVGKRRSSARRLGRAVSCTLCTDSVSDIPAIADVVLIAVPDRELRIVAKSLAALQHLNFDRLVVCHTSGALTTDVLQPLAKKGTRCFSLHPIQTFPKSTSLQEQLRSMNGMTYGIEGPSASLKIARGLVHDVRGESLIVPKEAKILYHLTCAVASNYTVTLIGVVEYLAKRLGAHGLRPFRTLIETSVANALNEGAAKALTGPIARGDSETVAAHLRTLRNSSLRALYVSLGTYALALAANERILPRAEVRKLRRLLKS